jgi:hypothetical protein
LAFTGSPFYDLCADKLKVLPVVSVWASAASSASKNPFKLWAFGINSFQATRNVPLIAVNLLNDKSHHVFIFLSLLCGPLPWGRASQMAALLASWACPNP